MHLTKSAAATGLTALALLPAAAFAATIDGGPGNDTSFGESGNDVLRGGQGDDTQHGNGGDDVIRLGQGIDVAYGEAGNDVLRAGGPRDVQPGNDQVGDTLDGGFGNDRFRTRDGEVDRITCGEGSDVAILDNVDVITDATTEAPNGSCETVQRKAPKASDTRSEDAQEKVAAERVSN